MVLLSNLIPTRENKKSSALTVSNWESLVKPPVEVTKTGSKRKR